MEQDNLTEIVDIFEKAQLTKAFHTKGCFLLGKLYNKNNFESFFETFEKLVREILTNENAGNSYFDRSTDFIASFCSTLNSDENEEEPLIKMLIKYLLEKSQSIDDTERLRSCVIINKILTNLSDSYISAKLWQHLIDVILERIYDSKISVRLQSILILFRLQDPNDSNDKIMLEFIQSMTYDSSPKIRQLCVKKIVVRKDVLPHMLKRIRDTDLQVRLVAFERFLDTVKYLKISERRTVLLSGFLDSSQEVNQYIKSTLLPAWLEEFNDDIFALMKSIRLDAEEIEIQRTVFLFEKILIGFYFTTKGQEEVFSKLPLKDNLILFEELNFETASYLRMLAEFLSRNQQLEELLNTFVLEPVKFCQYIKNYSDFSQESITMEEFIEKQFIIKQLFLIAKLQDYADPVSRTSLTELIDYLLKKVDLTEDTIDVITSTLELIIPDNENRSCHVCEIISDLSNDLQDDLTIKTEEDLQIVIKSLDIACGFLSSCKNLELPHSMKLFKSSFVQNLLKHTNEIIQSKALLFCARCSVMDKRNAEIYIHIFALPILAYQQGEECDTDTLIVCMKAISDLFVIYGTGLIAEPTEDNLSDSQNEEHQIPFTGGTSLTKLIQGLVELMDDEQPKVEKTAVIVLCKLVVSERIKSAALISRLILKWCNPDLENSEFNNVQYIIGQNLQKIPLLPESSCLLTDAVIMTLETLATVQKSNVPLAEVDLQKTTKFLLALCKMSGNCAEIYKDIAVSICDKILQHPRRGKVNPVLSKVLVMLDVPQCSDTLKKLTEYCNSICEEVKDKRTLTYITKFLAKLSTEKENLDNCNKNNEYSMIC